MSTPYLDYWKTWTPLFPEYRHADRVAIIGFARTSRDMVPWEDPNVDFWTLNEALTYDWCKCKEPAMHWQMHPVFDYMRKFNRNDPKHWRWLQQEYPFPIMMQNKYADVPSSVAYPLHDAIQAFTMYFTSTPAYMLALAILMGYKQIDIYGIEMSADSEYCVGPDMRVLTSDLQWLPAKDLEPGDEIVAFDEYPMNGDRRRHWRKAVIEATKIIQRPCYRLTLDDGTELVCSQEHRWLNGSLSNRNWLETSDINPVEGENKKSGHPSRLLRVTPTWKTNTGFWDGYTSGVFDSEGCLSQVYRSECSGYHNHLGFAQRDNEVYHFTTKVLDDHGFKYSVHDSKDGTKKLEIRGGVAENMRCLGEFRPSRLLGKFNPDLLGVVHGIDHPRVVKMEYLGWQDVVSFKSSTGTCVVEGIASHNSYQKAAFEYLIGFARGRGIEVYIPPKCSLLRAALYGYEDLRAASRVYYEYRLKELQVVKSQKEQVLWEAIGQNNCLLALCEDPVLRQNRAVMEHILELRDQQEEKINEANRILGQASGAVHEMRELINWHESQSVADDREDVEVHNAK